jgi:hypothetical protein
MGYDPHKQWSHKNSEGQREFVVLGVLSESRFVDPKQEKIEFGDATVVVHHRTKQKPPVRTDDFATLSLAAVTGTPIEPIEAARFRRSIVDEMPPPFDTPQRRRQRPKPEVPVE